MRMKFLLQIGGISLKVVPDSILRNMNYINICMYLEDCASEGTYLMSHLLTQINQLQKQALHLDHMDTENMELREIIESKCTALEVLERKLLDAEVERNRLRMINEDLLQALLYVLHTSCV